MRVSLRHLLLFCLCLLTLPALANPLTLNKHLTSSSTEEQLTEQQKLLNLEQQTQTLTELAQEYNEILQGYPEKIAQLNQQLNQAKQTLAIDDNHDLKIQSTQIEVALAQLKDTETTLNKQILELHQRQKILPTLIAEASDALSKQQKQTVVEGDPLAQQWYSAQVLFYQQNLATLQLEFSSSATRAEVAGVALDVAEQQIQQHKQLAQLIHTQLSADQASNIEQTLAENLVNNELLHDPFAKEINSSNEALGLQLQEINEKINQSRQSLLQAESQIQQLNRQKTNIEEQINWININATFGAHFLQILQSLPTPPDPKPLSIELADTRLTYYHLEQQQYDNHSQLQQTDLTQVQSKLLLSQQVLLEQLLEGYELYLNELAKLKISYEQLSQQYDTLKNILNEHLFWIPNTNPIGQLWLSDVHRSAIWLLQSAPWHSITQAFDEEEYLWGWWLILLILCIIIQDLFAPKFNNTMKAYAHNVGNVTQDNFIYTFKSLLVSTIYSFIWPIPIAAAGAVLQLSSNNFIQAIGMGIMMMGLMQLLYRFMYVLALPNGLFVKHFNYSQAYMTQLTNRLRRFMLLATPMLGIIGFTEVLDSPLIRNSIGRGAFIIFCTQLFFLYKDLHRILESHQAKIEGKNKRLLQSALWFALLGIPLACAVLSVLGYFFTAFQIQLQLQVSVVLGVLFFLAYTLIKRWMFIQRRQIAFERAKAKRAEILALREKGEAVNNDSSETYEEPVVDLETISSQSLGLIRSLLLLAFLVSLIALWSQSQVALFSFLDGISLWTTETTINGIDQQMPVTLKSLLLAIVVVGFSLMIATNLPGLLELVVLQKLELSPGTGFAITTVSRYSVVLIGTFAGFSSLGLEWSKLQWLIAALSVGLGFGLQEIFANFISGLIILFEKPIRIGDTVTIRDLTGTVSKIQIRATTIIDWDRKEVIVPNKAFITEQLINWSLSDPITRIIAHVSVARDADPAKVEAVLHQAVDECKEAVAFPIPEIYFAGFGQHTQDYQVWVYAKDMTGRWPLLHSVHKLINQKLQENGIVRAYPQLEVHVNGQQTPNKELLSSLIR